MEKKCEAGRYEQLDRDLRRARRWIDEGKLDDPSLIRAVESLEERLKLGLRDKRTEAEVGRLYLLVRDARKRLEHE